MIVANASMQFIKIAPTQRFIRRNVIVRLELAVFDGVVEFLLGQFLRAWFLRGKMVKSC